MCRPLTPVHEDGTYFWRAEKTSCFLHSYPDLPHILFADYSRLFMKMACEYLEGSGKFSTNGASSGAVVDPKVCTGICCIFALAVSVVPYCHPQGLGLQAWKYGDAAHKQQGETVVDASLLQFNFN